MLIILLGKANNFLLKVWAFGLCGEMCSYLRLYQPHRGFCALPAALAMVNGTQSIGLGRGRALKVECLGLRG